MKRLWKAFRRVLSRDREEGAAMVEYALLVCLIAIGVLLGVSNLGTTLRNLFRGVASTMATIPSNAH